MGLLTDSITYRYSFFSSPSTISQEYVNDAEEITQFLVDAASLKKLAFDYTRPELSVVTTDPTMRGCKYFSKRSSVA